MENQETFDAKKLRYILKNFHSLPLRPESKEVTAAWNPLRIMNDYLLQSKNGRFNARFFQKHAPYGRHYAQNRLSLQMFPREIRNTICGSYYRDFDIVNCQPTLTLNYCELKGYPCEAIRNYVNNRHDLLTELSKESGLSWEELKMGVLCIFYGGGLTRMGLKSIPKWLLDLRLELQGLQKLVYENEPIFAEFGEKNAQEKKEQGGYYNPKGSALSLLLQHLEDNCLQVMLLVAREMYAIREDNDYVPVFDGVQLVADYVPSDLIKRMEDRIYEAYGWRVSIIEKLMTDVIELPSDWQDNEETMLDMTRLDLSPWYDEVFKTPIWQQFLQGRKRTHMDYGEIIALFSILKQNVKYCRTATKWYLCQRGIWRMRDDIRTDFQLVMAQFRNMIKKYVDIHLMPKWLAAADNEDEQKAIGKEIADVMGEADRLGDATFMNKVIVVLPAFFYEEDFQSQLDTKLNLFAFSDCVYDLDTDEISPHKGENYVVTNTGYPFPTQRCEAIEKHLWDVFHSMFIDPLDALYMLKTIAYCLHGDKHANDLFFSWVGSGGNGKGCMLLLIQYAFGGYYKPLPVSYLTQKHTASSGPQPELADKVGVRMCVTTEPETEQNEVIRMEKIKGLSDPQLVRGLYQKPFTFHAQFGLIIQANQDPQFSSLNDATTRRYRGLHFPIQFKTQPDPNNPSHRQGDPNIKHILSLPEYRDSFILILMDIWRNHVRGKNDLEAPPNVRKYVAEVIKDNDIYGEFLRECVKKTDDHDKDKVPKTELFELFNEWQGEEVKITISQFGKKMKELGIKKNVRNYTGIQKIPLKQEEGCGVVGYTSPEKVPENPRKGLFGVMK